ncbi:hypothetical protein OGAPHI_001176 [Ogataea philodendri]|uniref:Uncharacterized protein n=1 Tax=Ogataea philodendri TaxID=1378263 RepID=A0A9P8PEY6_9ASCO|nr:uncharacterized protein OGAPHI_001176 [Ogataea philodendri]KAH3670661.1 hypothetical protein OGAPHI_001176 [Ogataea philodendri]
MVSITTGNAPKLTAQSSQLKLIPDDSYKAAVNVTAYGDSAPSAPGLHDTLRSGEGPLSVSSKINNRHPLEGRISNWEATQRHHQLETYRRIFGAADPIKREMELKLVQDSQFKPAVLGGPSDLHTDILLNRETTIDWEDIYTGKFTKPSCFTNRIRFRKTANGLPFGDGEEVWHLSRLNTAAAEDRPCHQVEFLGVLSCAC